MGLLLLRPMRQLGFKVGVKSGFRQEPKGLVASWSNGLTRPFTSTTHKATCFKVGGILKVSQTSEEDCLARVEVLRGGRVSMDMAKGTKGLLGLLDGGGSSKDFHETKWRSRVRDVVKGQVPSPMSGLVWSHMALTNETLMAEANRFPPLSSLGLMDYGSQPLMMLRQYGSLLENSGTDPKDPSSKELVIKARESKPSKALELACISKGNVSLPSM